MTNCPFIRYAVITRARDAKQLWAYLPENYKIISGDLGPPGKPIYLIAGRDSAGWTLDDYVIPRLASGLIFAKEIDLSDPLLKEVPL